MSTRCMFCGGLADCLHHGTGRDEDDRYLDPKLKFPSCHDDHMVVHDDWRTLRIEKVDRRLTFVERVELRLRRLAASFQRMDGGSGKSIWVRIAEALLRWADELRRFIDRLNQRDPGWRDDPGFYPA